MADKLLTMRLLTGMYGVCRLGKTDPIPVWALDGEFSSITRTMDELSVVCAQEAIPANIKCERDWKVFKIEGPLDFALIGILAAISTILAKHKISIFAISTYDTDYILVKINYVDDAVRILTGEGYEIIDNP